MLPEELDARSRAEAARRGMSMSELVRLGLKVVLADDQRDPADDDPWRDLAGFGSTDVVAEAGGIDDVVYGR